MRLKVGIDVGGTFTDFVVARPDGEPRAYKVMSTPSDPSIGLIDGLREIAASMELSLEQLAASIDTIVHGTTVTTNAVLTHNGAKTGLLTTHGVRDALEMRRGVREEQYNNRYTNVTPLVPRYLRLPVRGRLNYRGDTLEPLNTDDIRGAIRLFENEGIEAVAICFMNSFANADHERQAADMVRDELPGAFVTVSCDLLPSIRFYDRVSSAVLNSFVGPKLSSYLDRLMLRLQEVGFDGVLLVMQSNGGVMSPRVACGSPARTLLSGPAAGPEAGLGCVRLYGQENCITVDMGGTSFDASLVQDGAPTVVTDGEINRHRIALPMLDIVTIGAGGGSIGWIDQGGLLRMGPDSAGAEPGPACYGKGGRRPTCTDADLTLGYLDPNFFAGGRIELDAAAARAAVEEQIAGPLGLSVLEAAAGMYRVINTNMAQGVREISIKRGLDPREFPLVAAGGAGPLHVCMICQELDIAVFIVPRESSIFCAVGMLLSDLRHDAVSSFVCQLDRVDWPSLQDLVSGMTRRGAAMLKEENVPQERQQFALSLDCRYLRQYHEVSVPVAAEAVLEADADAIATSFHAEHRRRYGYSLEDESAPIELINVRLRATGRTEKLRHREEPIAGSDAGHALKGERRAYVWEDRASRHIPVYDGHRTRHGNHIPGPALIEQVNTTLLLSASYDCICDRHGSFVGYQKDRAARLPRVLQEMLP